MADPIKPSPSPSDMLGTDPLPAPPAPKFKRPEAAIRNGKLDLVDPDEIEYEPINPSATYNAASNLSPVYSSMKGARLMMIGKFFGQAMPLDKPEAPLVDSLDEDDDGADSEKLGARLGGKNSPIDGVIKSISDKAIHIQDAKGKSQILELDNWTPHNRKTASKDFPMVKIGDIVTKGQRLSRSNFTDEEGRLALGRNLNVGFIPGPDGSTFEDAIVVSQRAADALSSQHLYGYDFEATNGAEHDKHKYVSLFGNKFSKEVFEKFENNGMPKVGSTIMPGEPVYLGLKPRSLSSKDAALGNLHKVMRNSFQDLAETWEKPYPGLVTDAVKTRKGIRINVQSIMPARAADKVTSRFAAKGVISKVVPNEQMPTRPDGSDHLDVLINPSAFIGRVVPNMAYEALLGKIAKTKGVRYKLPSFAPEDMEQFTRKELEKHGIPQKEDLVDPRTGRKIPGVLTGVSYFLKLEHLSEGKISGRGSSEGVDQNDQPSRGGEYGSKRVAGLINASLISHGAYDVIRDNQVFRSGANPDVWRRIRAGQPLPEPKTPFIFDKFLGTLNGAGISVKKEGSKFKLGILTDKNVEQMAPHEIKSAETIDPKTGEPIKGGLMDFALFGGPEGRQMGYMKLDEPMPNPILEEPIRRFLGLTQNKYRDVIAGREKLNGKSGAAAIAAEMGKINLKQVEARARDIIRSGSKSKRDSAIKLLRYAIGMQKNEIEPADMIISKIPILPPAFRPAAIMDGVTLSADANYLYKDFRDAQDGLRKLRGDLPDEELADERLGVYDSLKAVQGMGDPVNEESRNKGVKGFIKQISGSGGPKTGLFLAKVTGHGVNTVGRAAIVPDDAMDIDNIGIPEKAAWRAFEPFVMGRMVQNGFPALEAARLIEQQKPIAKKFLVDEMKERPVMYTRDPAWHRYNIMGAFARLRPGSEIATSPLVMKSFGGDFDGDQMNFHVPVSPEAVRQVKEKMMPSQNLFNIRGFEAHYLPSQEFVLGLNNATVPNKKKTVSIFRTEEDALAAYEKKLIDIDSPIQITG